MAGFEPAVVLPTLVFETSTLNHSVTFPLIEYIPKPTDRWKILWIFVCSLTGTLNFLVGQQKRKFLSVWKLNSNVIVFLTCRPMRIFIKYPLQVSDSFCFEFTHVTFSIKLAEAAGFEPAVGVNPRLLSKQVP